MALSGAIGVGGAGEFAIGGSPAFDWYDTVLSQYANSPRLVGMLQAFAEAMDMRANLDDFYDFVWNIDTATGWGLDVWGRIVVINRTIEVNTRFFGFDEGSPDFDPFNVSPFFVGQRINNSFTFSDDAFRLLILAKALANITYGSVPGMNAILQQLFPGRGPCYVIDNQDMSMTYKFSFDMTPIELAIVETSNVLPRPTGVSVNFEIGP